LVDIFEGEGRATLGLLAGEALCGDDFWLFEVGDTVGVDGLASSNVNCRAFFVGDTVDFSSDDC